MTVIKVGFVGSTRLGSGVVVAKLSNGGWSAPSAIMITGAGFGGQIGIELADFVFVLNDASAVRTFAQTGSFEIGGNVSIAAGPVGRNAEAAGAVSMKGVAAIFSYSKTQGLFAGVSLEGALLMTRKDANSKMYQNSNITATQLLNGSIPPPPAADPLMRILHSRIFSTGAPAQAPDSMYNDVPVYDDRHDDVIWEGRRGPGYGEGVRRDRSGSATDGPGVGGRVRRSTWMDDTYDRPPSYFSSSYNTARASTFSGGGSATSGRTRDNRFGSADNNDNRNNNDDDNDNDAGAASVYSDSRPSRPTAAKPTFKAKPKVGSLGPSQALAKFNFDGDQPGDLAFRKGEVITIVKRTNSQNDWWTGRIGEKEGIFPRYVRTVCGGIRISPVWWCDM